MNWPVLNENCAGVGPDLRQLQQYITSGARSVLMNAFNAVQLNCVINMSDQE